MSNTTTSSAVSTNTNTGISNATSVVRNGTCKEGSGGNEVAVGVGVGVGIGVPAVLAVGSLLLLWTRERTRRRGASDNAGMAGHNGGFEGGKFVQSGGPVLGAKRTELDGAPRVGELP